MIGPYAGADLVGNFLAPDGFGIGEVAGSHDGHKYRCVMDLAGCWIDDRDGEAAEINEKARRS